MSRFGLSRGYSRQPGQTASPNWRSSLCNRLVSLANFGVAHPLGRAWDVVTNTPWTHTGTTSMVNTRVGRALNVGSSAGSLTNAGFTPSSKITGPWTVLMVASAPGSNTGVFFSANTQAAPYCANFSGVWSISNSANGSVNADGTMQVVAFRQFATTADVTVNGVKATGNAQNYAAFASGAAYIGDYGSSGGFPINGNIALLAVWNRALADSEIKSLSTNPWQLFYNPSELLESINAVSSTYNVSASEAASALDAPDRAGGSNYTPSQSDSGSATDSPSAVAALVASIAEAMSGSDSPSLPPPFSKTLVYEAWNASGSNTVVSGSTTFTCSANDTILVGFAGLANADQGACSDSVHGTISRITGAFNAWSNSSQTYGGFAALAGVSSGSHTVTLPTVSSGEDAVFYIWRLSGLPATLSVTSKGQTHQVSSSQTCTVTTDLPVSSGDQAFGIRFHENSVGSTDTLTRPSGWAQEGTDILDGSVILPTNAASLSITSGSSTLSGQWTSADSAITDTSAAIVVFTPTSTGSSYGVSASESGSAADVPSATGALVASYSEAASGADTVSGTYSTSSSISESASGADSSNRTMSTPASIAESASGADSQDRTMSTSAIGSETGTGSDSQTTTSVAVASQSEAGSASESQDRLLTTPATGGDVGNAQDTNSTTLSAQAIQNETGSASDVPGATQATSGTVSESGGASETSAADGTIVTASASESGAAAEGSSAIMATTLGIVESLAASDLSSCIGTFYGSVVEALSAVDSPVITSAQFAQMVESGALAEAQNAIKSIATDVLEAMALTDDPASTFAAVCQAIETADAQDVAAATSMLTAALIEAVAAYEFTDSHGVQFSVIGELVAAADTSSVETFVSSLIRMFRFAEDTRIYSFENESRAYRFPSDNVRTFQFSGEARNYRFKDGG